ncbi:MAG: ABC transporter ATP-binding protein [Myxococcota bacterium]
MTTPRVEAVALTRIWPMPGGEPVRAVDEVSFTVEEGTVYGLLGPNGAGKSTTMRMLATLTKPTSGTARVSGHDVMREPGAVRASLGYLSATSGLPSRVTCREVLELFAGLHRVDDARAAVDRAIERFGISDFAGRRIETLSTGMRQRVRIAAAAIHEPPVLILDEPTAGLDLVASDRLLESILKARDRGTAVIFSTHVLREAVKICDRIGVIDEGQLRAEGTVEELTAQAGVDDFESAFLALVAKAES